MFKAYLNGERPAELPEFSWFDLQRIYSTCPAKWKFEEKSEQSAAKFADHVAILSPESFTGRFLREPCADDYAEILTSDNDIKNWLKEHGVSGYSAKKYPELVELVDKTGDKPFILKREIEKAEDAAFQMGKTLLPAADWDRILLMRDVIFGNKAFADMLSDNYNDVLLCGELMGLPLRFKIDSLSKSAVMIDYVSCASAAEDDFRNQAEKGGYYIKQALLYDAFVSAYGSAPSEQVILCQERKYPHIPQAYRITDQHRAIGRTQYSAAITLLKACLESDSWLAYSAPGEIVDLPISPWFKKQYGIED